MRFRRSAGVLLHVSSLPGPCGIGDLGAEAYRFLDWLVEAGQSYWQVLPLGPDEHGNPYVAQSSWAGSPYFISLEELARAGDLTPGEVDSARSPSKGLVDYDQVRASRDALLPLAAGRFARRAEGREKEYFERFCEAEKGWLDDWALFAAAKKHFGGEPWWRWPKAAALRTGLAPLRTKLAGAVAAEKYAQFRFFEQWERLRSRAAGAGVKLVGDVPFYCARDSADVWAARDRFLLAADGSPKVVSGVPPDYFAKDGQLWGTPIYDWKKNAAEGFAWWIGRLRGVLRLVDLLRIDHFRAFEAYWEVQATAETARGGRWVKGPGDAFFAAVRRELGDAPLIAEDLGVITKPVRDLRDRWDLPGMRVLQFAFSEGAASPHLPIHHVRHCVVYSGTHDNDTTAGWYEKASDREKDGFRRFTCTDGSAAHHHMTRVAYASVADLAVVPMQDVLGLGSWARMNVPGVAKGNWRWKLVPEQVGRDGARMLGGLAETFGRRPDQKLSQDEEPAAA